MSERLRGDAYPDACRGSVWIDSERMPVVQVPAWDGRTASGGHGAANRSLRALGLRTVAAGPLRNVRRWLGHSSLPGSFPLLAGKAGDQASLVLISVRGERQNTWRQPGGRGGVPGRGCVQNSVIWR